MSPFNLSPQKRLNRPVLCRDYKFYIEKMDHVKAIYNNKGILHPLPIGFKLDNPNSNIVLEGGLYIVSMLNCHLGSMSPNINS